MASQVDRFYPNSRDAGDCPFAGDAEAIRGHVGDKANPHAVTAGQVGAYTKAEADAALAAHAARADNPHAVTAGQVPCGDGLVAVLDVAGNDNWSTCYGFVAKVEPGTVVRKITLRTSANWDGGTLTPALEVNGALSDNRPEASGASRGLAYTFAGGVKVGEDGVVTALFKTGELAPCALALRITTSAVPEGGALVTDANGGTNAAYFPKVTIERAQSVQDALDARLTEEESEERYLRVDSARTNNLPQAIRFYNHSGEEPLSPDGNSPFFAIGSQLQNGEVNLSKWASFWYYNGILFKNNDGERFLGFNGPGADKATANSIAVWSEVMAELAKYLTTAGGTVDGILRLKNPKVSADDDTSHDIALVPNANGQGLQVQFPGGSTAMIRMKTGTLATTAEVKDGDASTLASAKAYADGKVSGAYRYKGTVASKEALPASGNVEGDVWNVSADGMNYAWTGTEWDALGASVDLSAYYPKAEVDEKISSALGDIQAALAAI